MAVLLVCGSLLSALKEWKVKKLETERVFRYKKFPEYEGKVCPVTLKELNHVPCFIEITHKDVNNGSNIIHSVNEPD